MHKHHVKFMAEKAVKEPVTVAFRTKDGEPVSFDAHKKIKEEVEVDFMARGK